MIRMLLASTLLLSLTACGGGAPSGQSTTKLDAVEVQPGTISDSMIILDDSATDGTAIDNSVPSDGTAKPADADKPSAASDDEAEAEATEDETDAGDVVTAPVAKKAATKSE